VSLLGTPRGRQRGGGVEDSKFGVRSSGFVRRVGWSAVGRSCLFCVRSTLDISRGKGKDEL